MEKPKAETPKTEMKSPLGDKRTRMIAAPETNQGSQPLPSTATAVIGLTGEPESLVALPASQLTLDRIVPLRAAEDDFEDAGLQAEEEHLRVDVVCYIRRFDVTGGGKSGADSTHPMHRTAVDHARQREL